MVFGYDTAGSNYQFLSEGRFGNTDYEKIIGTKFTAPKSGNVVKIVAVVPNFIGTGDLEYKYAIYDSEGDFIEETESSTEEKGNGVETELELDSPVAVVEDEEYWLVAYGTFDGQTPALAQGPRIAFDTGSATSGEQTVDDFPNFPASLSLTGNTNIYSIYALYEEEPSESSVKVKIGGNFVDAESKVKVGGVWINSDTKVL